MSAIASWGHCDTKAHGRSAGKSAVAAIAYRFAELFMDERTDQVQDYTRKQGVLDKFIVAPENAPAWVYDPERLWNGAEQAEKRSNSVLYRETILALPAYLRPQERSAITREFAEALRDRYGVAVSAAIHAPDKKGDQRNYHAHLMFTTREITSEGFGKKTRVLDNMRTTGPLEFKKIQALGQDIMNRHLEAAGASERVDYRSFEERGIDREPTTHLGPAASEIERKGDVSERGNLNREIEERNKQSEALAAQEATTKKAIEERVEQLQKPARDSQDAQARLQGDKLLYSIGLKVAAAQEKDMPRDRLRWQERTLLLIARKTKGIFDRIALAARQIARLRKPEPGPERRERQQPTPQERRWQSQEQAKRQIQKHRGFER